MFGCTRAPAVGALKSMYCRTASRTSAGLGGWTPFHPDRCRRSTAIRDGRSSQGRAVHPSCLPGPRRLPVATSNCRARQRHTAHSVAPWQAWPRCRRRRGATRVAGRDARAVTRHETSAATRPAISQLSNATARAKVTTCRVQWGRASASQSPAGLASAILMSRTVSGRLVRPILTLLIQLSSTCSAITPARVTMPKGAGSSTLPADTKPSIAQVADCDRPRQRGCRGARDQQARERPPQPRPAVAGRIAGSQMPAARMPAMTTQPITCLPQGSIATHLKKSTLSGTRLQRSPDSPRKVTGSRPVLATKRRPVDRGAE